MSTCASQRPFLTPPTSPHGRDRPDAMWVGPPSPAQPDSLGFGDQSSSGKEALMTVYVGMDVHRKRSQVAIVDAAGVQQRNRNLANDPVKLVPVLGALPPGTPVAFEAAYGWGWLVDLFEERELQPHLVHPSRCKAIASARLKNDKVDAAILAQLLRADLLPEAWIAPPAVRQLRALLRHRIQLVRLRNRIHAVLADHGQDRPAGCWSGPGRQWLAGLSLPPASRRVIDD